MRKAIYFSTTPTKRGKDLAKDLEIEYISSCDRSHKKKGMSFFKKVKDYKSIILCDFLRLWRLKTDVFVFEFASDKLSAIAMILFLLIKRKRMVIDCHTVVYKPSPDTKNIIKNLSNKIINKADLFIAHNEDTLKLKNLHKNMVVVESKVPELEKFNIETDKINVVFITRFHEDEPIEEMINTSKLFNNNYHFYFSGNHKNKLKDIDLLGLENVTFTGFIPYQDYIHILNEATVIVTLTTRDTTLLYSGREAIALNKPLVISDTKTLRDYFTKGSVFVANTPESIKSGIEIALENKEQLTQEMVDLKFQKLKLWESRIDKLKREIQKL
jgi:glycosyltransferase involved in cell wall biosynthesis